MEVTHWTHTQTDRPPCAAAPQMPYGIVIIHGVSQLFAGPDKWNYTAQMRWLHTCMSVCERALCICVFVCLCVSQSHLASQFERKIAAVRHKPLHTQQHGACVCVGVCVGACVSVCDCAAEGRHRDIVKPC